MLVQTISPLAVKLIVSRILPWAMYHGGYTIFGRHSNRALNSLLQRSGRRHDLFPFFDALFCYLSEILIAGYRAGHFFGRGGEPGNSHRYKGVDSTRKCNS